jgi:peptide subunit release factor 1 (eRF1)
MEITRELQELAKFSDRAFPVFSVYLNTQGHEPSLRDRSTAFLARHLRQAHTLAVESTAARESLEQDLRRIRQWGEQNLRGMSDITAAGVALFTCSGADLWVEFPSPLPFDNQFTLADRPALWQLVCLDANYTNALVVLMDAQGARVCDVVLGGLLAETDFTNATAEPQAWDGWAQMRYRRELQPGALESHYRDVAEYLSTCLAERPNTYVILSGQDEVLSQFRHILPTPVRQQVIDEVRLELRDTHDRILEVARETLEQHDREEDRLDIQRLLNKAARGEPVVLGLPDTLTAVNAGVVHKLILHQDLQRRGWRCLDCDNIGAGMSQQCSVCSGKVMAVELREAIVNEVLRSGGFIEPIAPDSRLVPHDGVGALLHYTCVFRAKVATDSIRKLPPIPRQTCH